MAETADDFEARKAFEKKIMAMDMQIDEAESDIIEKYMRDKNSGLRMIDIAQEPAGVKSAVFVGRKPDSIVNRGGINRQGSSETIAVPIDVLAAAMFCVRARAGVESATYKALHKLIYGDEG